jgi:hypothetical protein
MTSKAVSRAARALARLGAKKGGKASAAALTPEQRKARAKAAIAARWKAEKGDELPIDQAAVMARLNGIDEVALRIAPGGGGRRRRAAIEALAAKGQIAIIESAAAHMTIGRPAGK